VIAVAPGDTNAMRKAAAVPVVYPYCGDDLRTVAAFGRINAAIYDRYAVVGIDTLKTVYQFFFVPERHILFTFLEYLWNEHT
jgi:hypothetical protein